MALIKLGEGVRAGKVKCKLGQVGHGAGDVVHGSSAIAIEHSQALQHQLAQDAQGGTGLVALCNKRGVGGLQHGQIGQASGQKKQLLRVAAVQALYKTGIKGIVGANSTINGSVQRG